MDAAVVTPLRLEGELVTIRPFDLDELDAFEAGMNEPGFRETPWKPDREVLRTRILRRGRFEAGELDLAIEAEGRMVGHIQARQWANQPPGVALIGIALFARVDRGRGLGTDALRVFSDHLFRTEDFDRLELSTDAENVAMRRSAERAGYTLEGVMRSFMPDPKGRRDYALYSMTRDDWNTAEQKKS